MKSSQPKISFIIPVKNRAKLLPDSLNSLVKQTESDWEAVIVDDGSTEDIAKVVKDFNDERVKYFRLEQGSGVAAARNYGNLKAEANILAVLDSDDVCEPTRAQVTLDSHAKHGWDFFSAGRRTQDMATGEIRDLKTPPPTQWNPELFKTRGKEYVTHSTVAYTKSAALEIPYNSALPCLVDYDLISRFIVMGKKMFFTPEPLVIWRRHDDTLTNAYMDKRRDYHTLIRQWRGWE